jgi:hypothetical protein
MLVHCTRRRKASYAAAPAKPAPAFAEPASTTRATPDARDHLLEHVLPHVRHGL